MEPNAPITAVCVDNGEPLLERCLQSLKQQSVPIQIIVAAGPKTDLAVAEKYADKVMKPVAGIGRARVNAIQAASTPYILSCDSDTEYHERYAEFALEDLKRWRAVKAGAILPLDESKPLAWAETATQLFFPYEFALGFRKQAFLDAGIHELGYEHPKNDIGRAVTLRLTPMIDLRMICRTRFPTYHAELAVEYIPIALAGLIPIAASVGIPLINELEKQLKTRGLSELLN